MAIFDFYLERCVKSREDTSDWIFLQERRDFFVLLVTLYFKSGLKVVIDFTAKFSDIHYQILKLFVDASKHIQSVNHLLPYLAYP